MHRVGLIFTRAVRNTLESTFSALKVGVPEAGEREIFCSRSRPCRKNDLAAIESKNNHPVRKYSFYYRHDPVGNAPCLPALDPSQ